jgi:hypothetical protein
MNETHSDSAGPETSFRPTKFRSPNYPVIGLRAAMNRARQLYKKYKKNSVPINLVHKEWDYKEYSGLGNQVVGALKAFGLVDVEGKENDRRAILTDLAYRILNRVDANDDWYDLLKKAVLEPPLYAELWAKWGDNDFPDDGLIKHYLVHDRAEGKFNPDKVDGFIANFRDSLRFSRLLPDGTIDSPTEDNSVEGERERTRSVNVGDYVRRINAGNETVSWPRLVQGFSSDGQWAYVDGCETGVPVAELTVMEPAKANTKTTLPASQPPPNPFLSQTEKLAVADGAFIKFDLPHGNSIEIRLKAKVTAQEFQKIKKIFELSELSFVQDEKSGSSSTAEQK